MWTSLISFQTDELPINISVSEFLIHDRYALIESISITCVFLTSTTADAGDGVDAKNNSIIKSNININQDATGHRSELSLLF